MSTNSVTLGASNPNSSNGDDRDAPPVDEFGDNFLDNFDVESAILSHTEGGDGKENQGGAVRFSVPAKVSPQAPPAPPTYGSRSVARKGGTVQETLKNYFGYSAFRPGQLSCIDAIVNDRRDTCVFWSTGSGKSMVYTIPPLHTGRPAVVISPLISLMRDQTYKLNAAAGKKISTFLGSGQNDYNEEVAARNGERLLIYITPEKLENWLDEIVSLHQNHGPLSCIAIDEVHCCSQWGLRMDCIRKRPELANIPIVALTGTSTSKVKADVLDVLALKTPHVAVNTVDRPNLDIKVLTKAPSGGYRVDLKPLVETIAKNPSRESTIVYTNTRKETESIAAFLEGEFQRFNPNVKTAVAYHAGMSDGERDDGHIGFLTGRYPVIVATTAFGMGIDKPDTRRVVHYSPPRTMEEYYQQIGRAGRDGDRAEVTMYANPTDFDKYSDDFYIKELKRNPEALAVAEASTRALKNFVVKPNCCRRAEILKFFNEEVPFPNGRCGTCDNCVNSEKFADDTHRDFAGPAKIVLYTIGAFKSGSSMSTITKLMGGTTTDIKDWQMAPGTTPAAAVEEITRLKGLVEKRSQKTGAFLKSFISLLDTEGYLMSTVSQTKGDYKRSYSVFALTPKGRKALRSDTINLPVPASVRQEEDAQQKRAEAKRLKLAVVKERLNKTGMKVNIPAQELEDGEGQVILAYERWDSVLEKQKESNPEFHAALVKLSEGVTKWRADTAIAKTIAPVNVCKDEMIPRLCYTVKAGGYFTLETLENLGLRHGDSLLPFLQQWSAEHGKIAPPTYNSADDDGTPLQIGDFVPDEQLNWSK